MQSESTYPAPPAAVRPARTALFVPGDHPGLFAEAASSRADLLVCDLEDAVGAAMLVQPFRRSRLMAVLRMVAMTRARCRCGPGRGPRRKSRRGPSAAGSPRKREVPPDAPVALDPSGQRGRERRLAGTPTKRDFRLAWGSSSSTTTALLVRPLQRQRVSLSVSGGGLAHMGHTPSPSICGPSSESRRPHRCAREWPPGRRASLGQGRN